MRKYLLLTKIAVAAISLWGGALYSMAQGYQATIPFTELSTMRHITHSAEICLTDGSDALETKERKAS